MTKITSIFLFLSLVLTVNISGQSPKYGVDLGTIKKNIKSKKKRTYYPLLFERFKSNDTTLTLDDYKHLYYGTCFQNNFCWSTNPRRNEILKLIERNDFERALSYCDSMLNIIPISSQLINLK